jgi:hypothetical protein
LLLALLALAAQLALGIAAPDAGRRPTAEQKLAALLADPGAICHGDVGSGQPARHHRAAECLLCPYCAAIATAADLHRDDPTLPMPRAGPIAIAIGAPQTIRLAPVPRLAARPRAPPILS